MNKRNTIKINKYNKDNKRFVTLNIETYFSIYIKNSLNVLSILKKTIFNFSGVKFDLQIFQ